MAGTVASPLLDMVCQRLDSHTRALSKSTEFIKMRLKLGETLALLDETERDGSNNQTSSLRIWLSVLRDIAYDVDALIDIWEQSKKSPAMTFPFLSSLRIEKDLKRIHGQLVRHLDSYSKLVPGKDVAKGSISDVGSGTSDGPFLERDSEIYSDVISTIFSGNDERIPCIIPIVGMGGIGKTVLARRIFDDREVKSHFQLRAWVSVGENLDLVRIADSIAAECSNEKLLEARKVLKGKKFLLVLDNVWDEDDKKLEELKEWLNIGDSGSYVLLTTRSSRIAALVGRVPAKHMTCLSDEDSWALFKYLAFQSMGDEIVELETIGQKIVVKCKGLPLAIKIIGGLLRDKNKQEWLSISRCNLWDLPEFKGHVLPVLKMSYDHLPSYLKQCFVYCSIFPKGYWINKEKLVRLWIAEGFVHLDGGSRDVEDIAIDYFAELFHNSFFLDVVRDDFGEVEWCRMHDYIHDLAQFVAGVECSISLSRIGEVVSQKMHDFMHDLAHLVAKIECSSLSMGYSRSVQGRVQYCSLVTPEPGKLRTLLLLSGKLEDVSSIFHMFSRLRVLDLSQSGLTELPISIGILKHLRYLDLSHTYIRKIPKSISKLKQLQTLELSNCYNLEELPKSITQLTKLRNLGIASCCSLIHMPSGIGKLRLLRKLPAFVLGKRSDSATLRELNWMNLKGRLEIKNLENIKNVVDAREANLHEKIHINSLELSWSCYVFMRVEISAQVMEVLRPPLNLKVLYLKGYRGSMFPSWMNQGPPNLVKISLINCICRELPPMGQLPNLKQLLMKRMPAVECIGYEFYGNRSFTGFPSLQQLEIYDMPNLVEWKSFAAEEEDRLTRIEDEFPRLEKLIVEGCTMLTALPYVPNLKNLALCNSNEMLLYSLSHLPSLRTLVIDNFQELECPPGDTGNSNSIKKLIIHECDSLEILFQAVQSFSSLGHLSILQCDKLDSLPMTLRMFNNLWKLDIVDCPRLVHIPDIMEELSCLVELTIESCPRLKLLPESTRFLGSLQKLVIKRCPALKIQLEMEMGDDWFKISHIPYIRIETE